MNPINVIWTNEDFEEYARQLELLQESYGGIVDEDTLKRYAADIVNKQKHNI